MTYLRSRLTVPLLLVPLLVMPPVALAAPESPAPVRPGGTVDRSTATSDAAAFPGDDFLGSAPQAAPQDAPQDAEPRIETYSRQRPVAPGVTMRSFDRYGPDGYTGTPSWLQADSLTVDLDAGTTVDYVFPGQVARGEPLTVQAGRAGAVAAVNGDFFDINNSTAPLGVGVKGGEIVQSPDTDPSWRRSAAIFTPDGLGSVGEVFFEGTIATPAGALPLAGVNKPELGPNGIEAFTPLWGTYCRCRATRGASTVAEVEVVGNRVTAVRDQAGEGAVPDGGFVLVGRDAGAAPLRALAVGDAVGIDYRVRTEQGQRIQAAVNGRQLLVVNGVPLTDFQEVTASIERWEDWCSAWSARAADGVEIVGVSVWLKMPSRSLTLRPPNTRIGTRTPACRRISRPSSLRRFRAIERLLRL